MSGAPSGQIGICFKPFGGCQMPWAQVFSFCGDCAVASTGIGPASGAGATAMAAIAFDHPSRHASSRQVRAIDQGARSPRDAMESMVCKAPFGGACDCGATVRARVATISFACLNQILKLSWPAVA
ncbi:hypothetical protein ASD86_25385 [Lysobacter sp. Root690]|nr:hypothetical protein ASD86_25385 [Lysobacter sp. Root690]